MARRGTGRALLATAALAYLGLRATRSARAPGLAGQVVLIAGGSRGLGLLLAREFAREGCRLVVCGRDPATLEAARRRLEGEGAELLALPCDVADPAQVAALVERAVERFGAVDVLVNVAAIMQVGPVTAMPREEFERAMAVNFWGAYNTTDAVLPGMRERGYGRIVNVTSIGGKVALPHMLPYCCAKFALVGLSEGLRAELAREGIRVTTVVPGLMRTGSQANAFYRGAHGKEWSWFTLSGATPLTSMDAGRAARRIVLATRRGEAELFLSWPAVLLAHLHGMAPTLTTDALALVNRLLPRDAGGPTSRRRGMEIATAASPSAVTRLMTEAGKALNQYAGRPAPSARHAAQARLDRRDRPA